MQIRRQRRGTAALLVCILLVPLLGLLAFSVDYGFILFVKTDLQRVADQAAVASVRDLMPDQFGNQDVERVRDRIREYVQMNLGSDFGVVDSDIEIGRFDPATIYGSIQLLDTGILDTVRVTLRRNNFANSSVSLYFARLFGDDEADVSAQATAVLQRARYLGPGTSVFPFSIERRAWNSLGQGETALIYGSGRIENEDGELIPGNWGTLDIGPRSNSSSALSEQILNGLSQNDLNSLHSQGAIPTPDYIDGAADIELNGETGLSAGLKHAVSDVEGNMRVAPIFKKTSSFGGSLMYEVVGWTAIEVVNSGWNGSRNSSIEVRKSYTYDRHLLPVKDLRNTTDVIEGAYTSPVLVQ